ncbi:Protein of unknown function [Lactobacillus hominis DSM 23910 = CRBIP 24.179]|uniref:Uncharacterized protein n=1 Tax=Lactobacillus hominis DSM 23910 = CRBIP 24.179 TaxID=1423758 RepID=I7LAK6_9LACO|nr:Protein of unknown function [Lactobacillus hominis DSM 23910 = CRBIP 24.179]
MRKLLTGISITLTIISAELVFIAGIVFSYIINH